MLHSCVRKGLRKQKKHAETQSGFAEDDCGRDRGSTHVIEAFEQVMDFLRSMGAVPGTLPHRWSYGHFKRAIWRLNSVQ
jgi:hypothetical protein